MSGFLRKNRGYLSRQVIARPWLVRDEMFRGKLRRGLSVLRNLYAPPMQTTNDEPQRERSFGILAIAVHPERQGLSAGKLLMEHSEALARSEGFRLMHLNVATDNEQAIRFYERLGWHKHAKNGAAWSGEMRKPLAI